MSDNAMEEIRALLIAKHDQYNRREFILTDPIQVPHSFEKKQDVEIAAFLTATIAWGNRASIIKNAAAMMDRMDRAPYDFVCSATSADLKRLEGFVHRTFNASDLACFVGCLHQVYGQHGGLEAVFTEGFQKGGIEGSLIYFRKVFMGCGLTGHSVKHVPDVQKGSAAKRLNLFLMWMVRSDDRQVHFGLWRDISQAQLMIPLDTHVANVARTLGLLKRKTNDWQAVTELTAELRSLDPKDPCKFDFSLFGLGLFDRI